MVTGFSTSFHRKKSQMSRFSSGARLFIGLIRRQHSDVRNFGKFSPQSPGIFPNRRIGRLIMPVIGVGGCLLTYEWYKTSGNLAAATDQSSKIDISKANLRPDLPIFDLKQVQEHNSPEKGIWVTFDGGVYDITKFVDMHPGGVDKIKLAYGGALEPFWSLYANHKTKQVLEILEQMRIGNLDPAVAAKMAEDFKNDPYVNEPSRHPALIPSSIRPFNAETPPEMLVEDFVTPNDLFFVRNHLPVPNVDLKEYSLEISGVGLPTHRYTLEELKRRFQPVTITATIQCAGNRRNELNTLKPVKGLAWGFTAISNARWTGVRLSDVLADLGLTDDRLRRNEGVWNHVHFEGLDSDGTTETRYQASIPVEKAVNFRGDVILAYEMNGEPLSQDHGFPIRVVVPGNVGARNVKWLSKIHVSDIESQSHWQQSDYKSFSPSTDWDTVNFKTAPAIQEAPIQSAICSPSNGETLQKGIKEIEVKGYAWSGGGRGVIRVDVSADGGKTWKTATMQQDTNQKLDRMWAWTLWSCKIPVITDNGSIKLVCKAVDTSYNVQPENVNGIWNLRGVLNNTWHRVNVNLER